MWWLSVATLVISSTVSNEKEQVINLFHRKANFENTVIHDTIGMETPWRYRNKSQIPVGKNEDNDAIMGFIVKEVIKS